MIKALIKIFYLITFLLFCYFILNYYFSIDNINQVEKKMSSKDIFKNKNYKIPYLKNNTKNVIIYNSEDIIEKKTKKRKIWELLN